MTKTSHHQLEAEIAQALGPIADPPTRYFARVRDVTKNRATVSKLLSNRAAAEAARRGVGRRLDVAVVERGEPMEVGERIWIGRQSVDTEIL